MIFCGNIQNLLTNQRKLVEKKIWKQKIYKIMICVRLCIWSIFEEIFSSFFFGFSDVFLTTRKVQGLYPVLYLYGFFTCYTNDYLRSKCLLFWDFSPSPSLTSSSESRPLSSREIADTLGALVRSQMPSLISRSLISHENIPGLSRLYSSILASTSGVATRGLLPPMTPGLMLPVSW